MAKIEIVSSFVGDNSTFKVGTYGLESTDAYNDSSTVITLDELEEFLSWLTDEVQRHNVETLKADGWIEWKGGSAPVGIDTKVEVLFRKREKIKNTGWAYDYCWDHAGDYDDIVAYRVVPSEGEK